MCKLEKCPICEEPHFYRIIADRKDKNIILRCQNNKGSFKAEVIESNKVISIIFKSVVSRVLEFGCPICQQIHECEIKKPDGNKEINIVLNCPQKSGKFKAQIPGWPEEPWTSETREQVVTSTVAINPRDDLIIETGKKIFGDSRSTLRDFCQYMATTSSGAIVTYTGLIGFIITGNVNFDSTQKIWLVAPAIIFLICIFFFVFAFQPRVKAFHLDNIDEINDKHNWIMSERRKYIYYGMCIFLLGATFAIYNILAVANTQR